MVARVGSVNCSAIEMLCPGASPELILTYGLPAGGKSASVEPVALNRLTSPPKPSSTNEIGPEIGVAEVFVNVTVCAYRFVPRFNTKPPGVTETEPLTSAAHTQGTNFAVTV